MTERGEVVRMSFINITFTGTTGVRFEGMRSLSCMIDVRYCVSLAKYMSKMRAAVDDKDLYSGLIRLHILHHAAKEPIFGFWMVEELARHGYKMSTGTLYPILHGLERKEYLRSHVERQGKTSRRIYQATPLGKRALKAAIGKVRELFRELVEEE